MLNKPKGLNPLYKKVVQYAKDRGITKEDIIRYNIGFCDSGIYTNRIIIHNNPGEKVWFISWEALKERENIKIIAKPNVNIGIIISFVLNSSSKSFLTNV